MTRTIVEIVDDVTEGRSSAVAEVRQATERIAERDGPLRAFVDLDPAAVAAAEAVDAQAGSLPLRGVPVGVKDIFDVAGLTTGCGSPITEGNPPASTAAASVRRLQDLGAVVVGKTVTTEFAYFTPGPTDNPAAPGHTPGGSSSGSAAAVAAGLVPLAIGSQTAGSTIRPASFCGTASMVLARGSTDLAGMHPFAPSTDSLGLFTATVGDLATAYRAFTGDETVAAPAQRVLVWRPKVDEPVDAELGAAVDRVAAALGTDEVEVADLDWDRQIRQLIADHNIVLAFEAARVLSMVYTSRRDQLGTSLIELIGAGLATSDRGYHDALARRDAAREELAGLLPPGTTILGPAALGPAPAGHSSTGSPILSRAWQLLGLPAVAVPGVRSSAGLPLGLQVIGWPDRQGELLATAGVVESLARLE